MKSITTVRITHLIAIGELFQSQVNEKLVAIIPKDEALPTYRIKADEYCLIEQLSGAVLLVPKDPIDAIGSDTIQPTELQLGYGTEIYPVYSAVLSDKKTGKDRPIFFIAGMVQTIYGNNLFLPTLSVHEEHIDIAALVKDPEDADQPEVKVTGFDKAKVSLAEVVQPASDEKVVVTDDNPDDENEEVEFDLIPTTSSLVGADVTQLNPEAFTAAIENSGYAHLFYLDQYQKYATIDNLEFGQQIVEAFDENGNVNSSIYEAFVGITTDDTALVWNPEFCAEYLAPVLARLNVLAEGQSRVIKVSNQFDCTSFESFCAALRIIKHLSLPFAEPLDDQKVEAFLADTAYVTSDVLGSILNIYVAINDGKTTTAWAKRGKACIVLSLLDFIDMNPEIKFTEEGALFVIGMVRDYYTPERYFEDSSCTNLLTYVPQMIEQLFTSLGIVDIVGIRCSTETSTEKRAKVVRAILNDVATVHALAGNAKVIYSALVDFEKCLSDVYNSGDDSYVEEKEESLLQLTDALTMCGNDSIDFTEYKTTAFAVTLSVCSLLHSSLHVTSINDAQDHHVRVKNLIGALNQL